MSRAVGENEPAGVHVAALAALAAALSHGRSLVGYPFYFKVVVVVVMVAVGKCEWNWGATVREQQRFCVVITGAFRVYPSHPLGLICERTAGCRQRVSFML